MKRIMTLAAAATVAATSAFAVTTVEDVTERADLRMNGIESIGQEVVLDPTFRAPGRHATFAADEQAVVTLVDTQGYDESEVIARR